MSDFKAKMHQIHFRLGLRPTPRWVSLSAPPAAIGGSTSKGREGEGERERRGIGRGKGGRGGIREGEGTGGEEEGDRKGR